MSDLKTTRLLKLCNENNIIGALAIDQRGALRRMLGAQATNEQLANFKVLVSQCLTPFASSILLDPEVGWDAAAVKDPNAGLLMAYEKTGYDKTVPGRYPDLIDDVSVYRLVQNGADAVKLLLYVDVDEGEEVNKRKEAFVERISAECRAFDIPFFLELVSYDAKVEDPEEYAALKPRKVIEAMRVYSAPRFEVDVLKVEVPVNMNFVEGYSNGKVVHSQAQAASFFLEQSKATNLPFIFLSAGVSPELFMETLRFAKKSSSTFNGVLCGRATWAGAVEPFKEDPSFEKCKDWILTQGKENIENLNKVLNETATPIKI